jgi:quercetin dioxygenase-like cupin family protein
MDRNNETRVVRFVEGKAATGEFFVRTLARGDHIALLEVLLPGGVSSPLHTHDHESVLYVLRGKPRTTIDGTVLLLGPGDSCLQPRDVGHSVEALEETLFLEIKSPAPNLDDFLQA